MNIFFTGIKFLAGILCLLSLSQKIYAQVSIAPRLQIEENFDSLSTNAAATLPDGWRVDKLNSVRTVGQYAMAFEQTERSGGNNLASNAANGIYNFGEGVHTTATDRALGGVSSGSASKSVNMYLKLKNNGNEPIIYLFIGYDVEKYRKGTNEAGFSIQLFHSGDGENWSEAGQDFITLFPADNETQGYDEAPGEVVSVENVRLEAAVQPGEDFYLAWNYSVASGSTTTHAQALAIDNVKILADNRSLNLNNPVGGESFFNGDTVEKSWSGEYIENYKLFMFDFRSNEHLLLAELPGTVNHFDWIIPVNATIDSTFLTLVDVNDTTFHVKSGNIYFIDTIGPLVLTDQFIPENSEVAVPVNLNFGQMEGYLQVVFNEGIKFGGGTIKIIRFDNLEIIEAFEVENSGRLLITGEDDNILRIFPEKIFEYNTRYYIEMGSKVIEDLHNNGFLGFSGPETWSFTTEDAPFGITFSFLDNDVDNIYFTGDTIHIKATGFPDEIPDGLILDMVTGIYTEDNEYKDYEILDDVIISQVEDGKLIVTGIVKDADIFGIIALTFTHGTLPQPLGPVPIVENSRRKPGSDIGWAFTGFDAPEGEILVFPALYEFSNLYQTEQQILFIEEDVGMVAFNQELNIMDNRESISQLNASVNFSGGGGSPLHYVEIDTDVLTFLTMQSGIVTLYSVPQIENLKIKKSAFGEHAMTNSLNDPTANATIEYTDMTLAFQVDYFSRFTVFGDGNIELTKPAGGEGYETWDTLVIEWNAVFVDDVAIEIYCELADEYFGIDTVPGNSFTYEWAIPNGISSGYYKLRVISVSEPEVFDESGIINVTDIEPPAVIDFFPENYSENIPVDTALELTFDEKINIQIGNIKIHRTLTGDEVESMAINNSSLVQLIRDQKGLVIFPGNKLEQGTGYFITMDYGTVKDLSGNSFTGFSGEKSWHFTTAGEMVKYIVTFMVTANEKPVPSAEIYIEPVSETLITSISGEASIELPNGTFYYHVVAEGFDANEGDSFMIDSDDKLIEVFYSIPTSVVFSSSEIAKVYPNPSSGMIFIETTGSKGGIFTVELMDISGRVVISKVFYKESPRITIDAHKLSKGLYLMKIFTDDETVLEKLLLK